MTWALILTILITPCFTIPVCAQPYQYHHAVSQPGDDNSPTMVVQFDLSTGISKPLFIDSSFTGSYDVTGDEDDDADWLILFPWKSKDALLINTNNPARRCWLPVQGEFYHWSYSKRYNKIFYQEIIEDSSNRSIREIMIDGATLAITNQSSQLKERVASSAFSKDGTTFTIHSIFENPDKIELYSENTGDLMVSKLVGDIGEPAQKKTVKDIKGSKVLVSYHFPTIEETDNKLAVYDSKRDSTLCIIRIGFRADIKFNGDGRYIIAEETPWMPGIDPRTNHLSTGKIHVYDSETGAPITILQATPKVLGKVFVYSTFPEKIFYVDKSNGWSWTSQAINIKESGFEYNVKLTDSFGRLVKGGILQYYDGIWKDGNNNNDGTFNIYTDKKIISVRMSFGSSSQTKTDAPTGTDTIIFQTVNVAVQLKNSSGALMDTGTVQYYAGAWREFGVTKNGIASKELLPGNYSFRMTYGYAGKDAAQDIGANPTVTFTTVKSRLRLRSSADQPLDTGTVQYYAGAWRPFGTTVNGEVSKELLPNSYSFRTTYAFASQDKVQHLASDPVVVFRTVPAAVQLKNSQGALMDQGAAQYYAGAWRPFGTTSNGTATKELLPVSYSFRMTHEFISNDKTQNIGTENPVIFTTVPVMVSVKNIQNAPVANAAITYYAGAWRTLGTTGAGGDVSKELLPANLPFRAKAGTVQQDKTQNTGTNPAVNIQLNVAQ